jgi:hypothetical protein
MENKIIVNETYCKENKCLVNMWSETCRAMCEVENGYCVYEEIEFLRKCKFEDYIERSFPGENFEEKMNHYYYDCFENEESIGSNFELEEIEEYDKDLNLDYSENLIRNDNKNSNCPIELTELYYRQILKKLSNDIWLLNSFIENFNEANIIYFKKWFIRKFNEEEDEINYKFYNWSIEFTRYLMCTSLKHVKEDYSIHEYGGGFDFFFEKMLFLSEVASAPFEAELFALIEDDWGIFEDED